MTRDSRCLVPCSDGSYCRYELAAVAIGVPGHYYAYVNEKNQHATKWVKYNDSVVTECEDTKALEKDMSKNGVIFVYRKLPPEGR